MARGPRLDPARSPVGGEEKGSRGRPVLAAHAGADGGGRRAELAAVAGAGGRGSRRGQAAMQLRGAVERLGGGQREAAAGVDGSGGGDGLGWRCARPGAGR